MKVTFVDGSSEFTAHLNVVTLRTVINTYYLKFRKPIVQEHVTFIVSYEEEGDAHLEMLNETTSISGERISKLIVSWEASLQVYLIDEKKRKAPTTTIYNSLVSWEDTKLSLLKSHSVASDQFNIVNAESHTDPTFSAVSFPRTLSIVPYRICYSSLTLDMVLPRINAPNSTGLPFCFQNIHNDAISTTLLATSVDAYLGGKSDSKKWGKWVRLALQFLDALHDNYEFDCEPKEAPRRTIVDLILLAILSTLPAELKKRYCIEKDPFAGMKTPPFTVGWGMFDYFIGNLIIADVEEEQDIDGDFSEITTEMDGSTAEETPPSTRSNATITDAEIKRRSKLNDHALAQVCGQGYDALFKRRNSDNEVLMYPLTEESKPTVLYHGKTLLAVLPYRASVGDVDNSGLLDDKSVDKQQVARAMATLGVCLERMLDVEVPMGWN